MSRRFIGRGICALLLVLVATLAAAQAPYRFDNARDHARFRELIEGLRCLVCQGQSIADSNADLAEDMRDKVHELILAGESDAEIRQFMTRRHGDFVLFRPRVKPSTWLLWFAPALLGLAAVSAALALAYKRRSAEVPQPLTPGESRRIRQLLDDDEDRA